MIYIAQKRNNYKYLYRVLLFLLLVLSCDIPINNDGNTNTTPSLEELWRVYTPTITSHYPPAYSDGIVYTTVGSNAIHAYNAKTGELVWLFNPDSTYIIPSVGFSRINIQDNRLFVVINAKMYCFDKKTGNLFYTISGIKSNGVTTDESHVYVTGLNDKVYAADITSGAIRWENEIPARLSKPPGIDGDFLYYAAGGDEQDRDIGYLVKIKKNTGNVIYSVLIKTPDDDTVPPGPVETPVFYQNLVITDGGVVGGAGTRLNAFNKETGELVWSYYYHGGGFHSALIVENGVIYCATLGTDVFAFDAANGQVIWKTDIQGSSFAGPVAIYQDYLFFDTLGYTYCVNKTNGKIFYYRDDLTELVVHNDTLFAGGYLYPPHEEGESNFFSAFLIK